MTKSKIANGLNLILGAWLISLPWSMARHLATYDSSLARLNFVVMGTVIILSSLIALRDLRPWEEWINVFAGVWLMLSPWVFGYATDTRLTVISVIISVVTLVDSFSVLPTAQKIKEQRRQ